MDEEELVEKVSALRSGDVGRTVAERMREFKALQRKSSEHWFSELCFCILTANSTAKLGIKIQRELGSEGFLKLPEIELAEKLRQLRHRFYNTRAEYIVEARRFHDIKRIINGFADEQRAREWLVENVKGIGYKEASLPGWEHVLVLVDGEMRNEPIEKVAEMFHHKSGHDVRTFSFNPETLKFKIVPVTNVFAHTYNGDLYEFQLQTGRKVVVTGNHSLFTLSSGRVVAVEARKLKVGDFVAIPRLLPEVSHLPRKLNVIEELLRRKITKDVYVRGKAYNEFLQENYGHLLKRKNQYTQRFRGILPLTEFYKLPPEAYNSDVLEQSSVRVGVRRSKGIKAVVQPDNDLFWLLGLITAEGSVTKNPVEISQSKHELHRLHRVQRVIKAVLGIDSKIYDRGHEFGLKVYCPVFWHLIHNVFGASGDARTKKVPGIVLSASREQILHFLQGEWEGDGWQQGPAWLSVATMSDQLAAELLVLFLISGAVANHHIGKRGIHVIDLNRVTQPLQMSNKISKRLDLIPGAGELLFVARRKLGLRAKVKGKHTKLYSNIMRWHLGINQPTREKLVEVVHELEKYGGCKETAVLKRLIESDLMWVKVRSIRKFQGKTTFYDLEVASKGKNYQNFVGGFGGVCLHNSHFLRNVGFDDVAILDRHVLSALCEHGLIDEVHRQPTRQRYFEIEEKLRKLAQKLCISLGELDLYLWYLKTGEILK